MDPSDISSFFFSVFFYTSIIPLIPCLLYMSRYIFVAKKKGTVICNIESSSGDRGKLARASGDYATIVAHNRDENITRVRLPSGAKKAICSDCRGIHNVLSLSNVLSLFCCKVI